MIPIRDNIPPRTTPLVNYTLIAVCGLVFLAQRNELSLVERYGMIPQRVMDPGREVVIPERRQVSTQFGMRIVEVDHVVAPSAVPPWLTLLTCIFLHGGWMHFLGNMWFLFIFGDNVEDRLGHVGFLVFYLASGIAASAAHLATNPGSPIPTIGASGAIAGVMGAYFYLYPHARVLTIVPIFFILQMIVLPASVFLAIWFVLQFFQGVFSVGSTRAAGVAWWAHIGGFVVGLAVAFGLNQIHFLRPKVDKIRPHTDHAGSYRIYPPRP
ncbi:MAG: rhomboid family intramembrane serine protease [Planctomycetales bacterium]|nr:rhomboid family intramembrane serine protease [Planctomycetales bacterium]NIM09923.1 rhomboid family intramembrane serine protease [Planctomycetales bacterium]NIN09362.1 rhomboid family intramembrane serine protease [Planctomycetales bacterium]NIN78471.1 rhomboid family intramembrane serine protease [Planctomycetales bacterium]NIO35662.1 rhomboid family intramembrane serine protease [Planctomycetales bacterium]